MNAFLRVVRLLAIVVWVGGLIFFAFVVAPVAFHVLPSKHEAGLVVAGTLDVLNRTAGICWAVFSVASMLLWLRFKPQARMPLMVQVFLVWLMVGATLYVQTEIVPQMERDRIAAGGDVDAATPNNPARLDFERLHPISEKVEGAALFLGLGVVVLMGLEDAKANAVRSA